MSKSRMLRKYRWCILAVVAIILVAVAVIAADRYNLLPQKSYTAEDFGIEIIHSSVDFNGNGTDDYTDLLRGAREDAQNHPRYDGAYYEGGYPPENIGVCTDVIWRAFRYAGYDLKAMVDADILERLEAYDSITEPDPNIDFRRVRNLHVFFEKYAVSLTTDVTEIDQWQPGDIVIFGNDRHIGIVSDKRNADGEPYIIHNGGQPKREEDYLRRTGMEITGHYRFDASGINPEVLSVWKEE